MTNLRAVGQISLELGGSSQASQLVHHIYMDWFKGTSSRKAPNENMGKSWKIDGFRLRFSLQPIHWATQFWENVRNGDLLSLTNHSAASSSYCPSAPQTHVTRKTMVDAKQLQLDSTITGNIISYIFCSMGKDGKMRKPKQLYPNPSNWYDFRFLLRLLQFMVQTSDLRLVNRILVLLGSCDRWTPGSPVHGHALVTLRIFEKLVM